MVPARMTAEGMKAQLENPFNPASHTPLGKVWRSAAEMFEQVTRKYGKPQFNLNSVEIDGINVPITEEIVITRGWCNLLYFRRGEGQAKAQQDPKLLIVAPLSGHYATLLRGTVEAMLPDHEVYITDWKDARLVPLVGDDFGLADYCDYIVDFLHYLGPNTHIIAVCQPSVPVMAAVSVMSGWGDLCAPASMTLIGGPIDTRTNPTAVNLFAKEKELDWYKQNVISTVPPPNPGMFRQVYPGFIQLTNFISMNFDKHMESLSVLFEKLIEGDDEEAEKKRSFYEEYLAVMDLSASFYLQTVDLVFLQHALPKGEMVMRWHPVLPDRITRTAILCVEGELDDISGVGQTKAALELTPNLSPERKAYYLQPGVGHYGVFNGRRWREQIAPRIKQFIREHDLGQSRQRPDEIPLERLGQWVGMDRRIGKGRRRQQSPDELNSGMLNSDTTNIAPKTILAKNKRSSKTKKTPV